MKFNPYAHKPKNATELILLGLLPYTDSNLKLAYKPNIFFNELDKLSKNKYSDGAKKTAFYRAIKKGYIETDNGTLRLTSKGRIKLHPYQAKKLKGDVRLMVIFDIPENVRHKRRLLRTLLIELKFQQIQLSVWTSSLDSRIYLLSEIRRIGIEQYVIVYEAHKLT